MRIKMKYILPAIVLAFLFSTFSTILAQGSIGLYVDHIDNGQFPLLEVYLSVTDVQGFPIKNLTGSNFVVTEDGRPVSTFEVLPTQDSQNPLAVALVIDTSGSMGSSTEPTPLQNAIGAAKSFVDSLSTRDQVAIVGFADSPYTVQEFTSDKDLLKSKLDTLTPAGETTMYDGIVEGVNLLKNRSERRILVLIADGKDTGDGKFDFTTSMDEASRWAVPLYPLGFGNVDRKEMEQMAALTGGTAQIQPNSSDLQAAFGIVLQILREQYLIRYESTLQADAAQHDLQITVDHQGYVANDSRSFIALPGEITLTLPFQDNEVVGGNVLLKPGVLAPAPLKQLEIQLDGSLLQSVLSEPFEYAWDSTTVSPGSHQFIFTVTDQAGNSAKASVELNIQAPITVKVVTPKEGEELSGSSKVVVEVNSLAGIAQVAYAVDGKVLETITAPPYEASLNWDKYAKGPHLLAVTASDVNGFTDSQEFVIQAKGTRDIWFLVLVLGLGFAALAIPIGLRQRRKTVVAAGKPQQLVLRQIQGQNSGQTWALGPGEIKVGRRQGNDVRLKSTKASREHALIRYENGNYVLYNLRPENPPLVNNNEVQHKQILKPGDVIQFGEDALRYEE
jgi:VWFA-related protein